MIASYIRARSKQQNIHTCNDIIHLPSPHASLCIREGATLLTLVGIGAFSLQFYAQALAIHSF
jgi:hypothetical protein